MAVGSLAYAFAYKCILYALPYIDNIYAVAYKKY